MNSKISNLYLKSKNTSNVLQEILNTITVPSTINKNKKIDLQYKETISTQPSISTDRPLTLNKFDILISEMVYEMVEYHKLSQLEPFFTSELNINSKNINKSKILEKLGISDNKDKSNILENVNLPLLYFIIFYFIQSIKENYEKIIKFFKSTKNNNLIEKTEQLLSQNLTKKHSEKKFATLFYPTTNLKKECKIINEKNYNFDQFKNNVNSNKSDNDSEEIKIQSMHDINNIAKEKIEAKSPKSKFPRRKQSVCVPKFEFGKKLLKTESDLDNLSKLEKCPFIEQNCIF